MKLVISNWQLVIRPMATMVVLIAIYYLPFTNVAFAQETYKLSVPIPVPGEVEPVGKIPITDPAQAVRAYVTTIFRFGLGIGAFLAVAIIIFAAIKRIVSAGNTAQISDANDMILNAIWGLVLLLGSVLILRTINPQLLKLELPRVKPVEVKTPDEREKIREEIKKQTELGEIKDIDRLEQVLKNLRDQRDRIFSRGDQNDPAVKKDFQKVNEAIDLYENRIKELKSEKRQVLTKEQIKMRIQEIDKDPVWDTGTYSSRADVDKRNDLTAEGRSLKKRYQRLTGERYEQ